MTTVHLDDELVALLRETDDSVDEVARDLIVLELYRRGTISSGRASRLLGMTRADFLRHASRLGSPTIDMTETKWEAEPDRLGSL